MLSIIIFGSRKYGNALFCSFEGGPLQSVAFAFEHKPGFEECQYRIIKKIVQGFVFQKEKEILGCLQSWREEGDQVGDR